MGRRGNGEGSITERPDGRWMGQATVGWNPDTKEQRRVTVYGRTRREALEKLEKAREAPRGSDMTVRQAAEEWLREVSAKVSENSAAAYKTALAHINAGLGAIPLRDLHYRHVSAWREKLCEKKTTATARYAGGRLRAILDRAVRLGHATVNAASQVPLQRHDPPEVDPILGDDLLAVLRASEKVPMGCLVRLAVDSGMRIGELLALREEDISPDGTVQVMRQVSRNLQVKPCKTKHSLRRVPCTEETMRHLGAWLASGDRAAWAARQGRTDGLVFPSLKGGYWQYAEIGRLVWRPILELAKIRHRKFHSLRHSCATILLAAGVNPKIAQYRLGHSDIKVTLGTYSHLLPTSQSVAVAALAAALQQ